MKMARENFVTRLLHSGETLLFCAVLALYACVLPLYAADARNGEEVSASASVATVTPAPSTDILYETMRRDELRQSAIDSLAGLAADPSAAQSQREQAQEQLEKRLRWAEQEATIEEELSARGYPACVVNIATGFASVMIESEPDAREVAAICEAVERISGLTGGDIRVIPLSE